MKSESTQRARIGAVLCRLVLAVGVSAAATWPLVLELNPVTRLSDQTNDDYIYYWDFWWLRRALFEMHCSPLFCPEIFHPNGASLVASPLALPLGFLSLPLQALFPGLGGLVLSVKLFGFLTFPVAILGMRRLLRSLGVSSGVAFLAGCFYACVSFRLLHLTRIHYLAGALTPWFLFALWSAMKTGAWGSMIGAGVLLALAGAINASLLLELGIAGGLVWMAALLQGPSRGRVVFRFAVSSGIGVLILSPLLVPFLRATSNNPGMEVSQRLEFEFEPEKNQLILSPDLNNLCYYLSPSLHECLLPKTSTWARESEPTRKIFQSFRPPAEGCVLPVLAAGLTLLLACACTLLGLRERRLWPFVVLALLGFLLALGPYRNFGDTVVAMPYHWLTQLVPGMAASRYPAAHLRLFHLGIAVLAAAGLQSAGRSFFALSLAALALSMGAWCLRPNVLVPMQIEDVYQRIAADPAPGAVLDLPPRSENGRRKMAMGQIAHRRPLINGPITRVDSKTWDFFMRDRPLVPRWMHPPRPRGAHDPKLQAEVQENVDQLRRFGIRYAVIRNSLREYDPVGYGWLEIYLGQHPGLSVERMSEGHLLVRVNDVD